MTIELIVDILFVIIVVVLIISCFKAFEITISYEDKKSGIFLTIIGITYLFSIISSLLAIAYVIYLTDIHIFQEEYAKIEGAIFVLISTLTAYFISSKIKTTIINYCKKEGFIADKKKTAL
jgi:formate hydrogenlyase subunit 3/multisubunit Na+/H+ antiporter MnhD subunit